MTDSISNRIRIVLVETTHPGNIGATARAMKTMGLDELFLVSPAIYPSAEATARAAGADDILENAILCRDLGEAVQDCSLVYGTSARDRSISLPVVDPAAAVEEAGRDLPGSSRAAFVFGRESSGLSNRQLELCNRMLQIPSNPAFSSLNLAAAVQIIGYELRRRMAPPAQPQTGAADERPVSSREMQLFYQHLENSLIEIGFLDPDNPKLLMRRMRRLFSRVHMDRNEYNIMRGVLTAMQEQARRKD